VMVLLTVGRLSCDAECFNDELYLSDELLLGVAAVKHGSEIGVGNYGVGEVGDCLAMLMMGFLSMWAYWSATIPVNL
jgi:hypothetical protein